MNNGDIVTTAMRKEISIVLNNKTSGADKTGDSATAASQADQSANLPLASQLDQNSSSQAAKDEGPFKIVSHGEVQVTFRSKAILLSNGGQ